VRYRTLASILLALTAHTAAPASACDCAMSNLQDIPGETAKQRIRRETQAEIARQAIVLLGRFVSVQGVDSPFLGKAAKGRFEVKAMLKGTVGPFVTVYTDMQSNCSTPEIFKESLHRRDNVVVSVHPQKSAGGISYEIDMCDIHYFPADQDR
jgi:hypothetical protein